MVDGEERVEETPRECRFGYPRPLLCFMTAVTLTACVPYINKILLVMY